MTRPASAPSGTVAELRRYPVKSLVGEVLSSVAIDARGMRGDRRWAAVDADGKLGSGKSTRRFRRMDGLLELTAGYGADLEPVITFPDGRRVAGGDPTVHQALSEHVGRAVQLRAEEDGSHFDEGPLHLVTTASLATIAREHGGAVSTARLRSNLLVDVPEPQGLVEETWIGRTLAVGPDVVLHVREPMVRCVMVDLPQVGLDAAPGLLGTLGRVSRAALGVVVDVVTPGIVSVGDRIDLVR